MHTNTSSQKNQHRDILAKKKKTQTEKQTNPNEKTTKETDRCLSERSELVGLAWSELVGLAWSELVGMGLDRSSELWIGAAMDWCCYGSMLVIGAVDRWSEVWIDACDRSCGSVIGAVMMWIGLWPRGRRWDREIDREGETGYGEIEEREREIRKYDRERESAYKNGWGERYNRIIKKINYLNKRGDRIDELMWVFCKNDSVK